jgi:hypothetical protein
MMRRHVAASFVLGAVACVSQSAPANFDPKISDIIELASVPFTAEVASEPVREVDVERDAGRRRGIDSPKEQTRLTSLDRAKLALAASDATPPSQEEICAALVAVARQNDLPVGFFTNLIWQESRFDHDAISPVGAMGIAQFMPAVADALALDAFDARDALPASGKLLRTLRGRFGNLGLVAAAYNAGPKRVSDWLAGRSALPSETRDYVNIITGRPADQWRAKPGTAVYRVPRQVPCHRAPTFASVEQAERATQIERVAEEQRAAEAARIAERKLREAARRKGKQQVKTASSKRPALKRMAETRR